MNKAREIVSRVVNRAIANGSPVIVEQRVGIGQTVFEHDDPSWLGKVIKLSDDGAEAQVNWGDNLISWCECRDLRTGFE